MATSTLVQETVLGQPLRRVDGPLKVTGQAKYAAEYVGDGLLHGFMVSSAIASGRVTSFDLTAALAFPGVVKIYTHGNRPELSDKAKDYNDETAPPGTHFRPLHDDVIQFSDQPIALVVADSFENARDAAALVKVTYEKAEAIADFDAQLEKAYKPPKQREGIAPPPEKRGDFEQAYGLSSVRFEGEYRLPFEHHNPTEPFATTCVWNADGSVTVYDKTQGSQNCQQYVMNVFDFAEEQVRVVNSFVGGGFGSGLRPQHQLFFAVMAAKDLERPVRVVMERDQMWALTHRPQTLQRVKLGASLEGKLEAMKHHAIGETSTYEDHQEVVVNWTGLQYKSDNAEFSYELVKLNVHTPGDMRAPGAVVGQFAAECAMDELAYALKMDPIELRLKNYTERDLNDDKAFTSKALRECYEQGAKAFGWEKRNPEPRSMRGEGHDLIGCGMAAGVWEAKIQKTAAEVRMGADGFLTVASATSDIGTGTYTVMAQAGADAMGLPIECVIAKLGDSSLPKAPVEGGSWAAASTCSAIMLACEELKKALAHAAHGVKGRPIGGASVDEVVFADGRVALKGDPSQGVSLAEIVRSTGKKELTAQAVAKPDKATAKKYTSYTHQAIFCEVRADEELGAVRVSRIVLAVAAGRILNPKTARSQVLGGAVMALGAALEEESFLDAKLGRFMNHNLAEYHVPVNADIGDIEVIFVHERDEKTSPIGAKGLGEIGIVGTSAAIANAIYHATGRRVRDLPITIDKVLGLV